METICATLCLAQAALTACVPNRAIDVHSASLRVRLEYREPFLPGEPCPVRVSVLNTGKRPATFFQTGLVTQAYCELFGADGRPASRTVSGDFAAGKFQTGFGHIRQLDPGCTYTELCNIGEMFDLPPAQDCVLRIVVRGFDTEQREAIHIDVPIRVQAGKKRK